jgi:glycerol uptake facilitator-like aquaporin
VYVFGPASGAHFNPAVTVALMSIGKIKKRDAAFYLLCQFVGAYLGFWVAYVLIGSRGNPSFSLDGPAFLGEVLGTFLLLLAIASVVLGRISASLSGVVIGLALTIGISISLITSGGVLNPAIALSLGAMHFSYLAAPFIGALLGALFISWLYAKPSDVK